MAVTTDLTGGANGNIPYCGNARRGVIGPVRITIPVTGVTNDILQCIPVRAGMRIHGVLTKQITQGTATTVTLDIGITGAVADGLNAAIDGKSAAGTVLHSTPSDTWPALGGYYVTADDTVDILLKSINTMTVSPVIDMYLDVEDVDVDYAA